MVKGENHAACQLGEFKQSQPKPGVLTTSSGAPVYKKDTSLTAGERGPTLLQDVVFLDEMSHFDHERIPERVVHAKGGGAHGYFEVTHDISKYSKACIFNKVSKQTPLFIRFSTVAGERGSADTARDPRGFAIKFYTEEGNWDLVGNNTPIFFIRDAALFASFVHVIKRNPVTNLKDPNMMWDFISLRPESLHQTMFMFSDRGTPGGFRHMNGYGSHTFKLVNKEGEAFYCKFHIKTAQGIKNLPAEEAKRLEAENPDYSIEDLYNSIATKNFPSWEFFIQIMTFEEAEKFRWNPFDVTKVWPHAEHPLIPVGKIVLDRNPCNYFSEVEQVAFNPSHIIPGIDWSPDKMLQGRLFAYPDTHFHRLGPNYMQLPINCPYRTKPCNYMRDGLMALEDNHKGAPNYYPNSFHGPIDAQECNYLREHPFPVNGDVDRHDQTEDYYDQPRVFWEKILDEGAKKRLVQNLTSSLSQICPEIQSRVIEEFTKVSEQLGGMLEEEIKQQSEKPSYCLAS